MAAKQRNKRKSALLPAKLPTPLDAEEQAFLDAIAADPDDDEPRLVYADFLESRGDPRGELIQLQCQLDKTGFNDPRRKALADRAEELVTNHLQDWLVRLWKLDILARFGVKRGCVESMSGGFSAVSTDAATLAARAPALSRFELTVDGQLDRVSLNRPKPDALVRAQHLHIRGRHAIMSRDGQGPIVKLDGLAKLPFAKLTSLALTDLRVTGEDLRDLLASPHLAKLESLRLRLRMDDIKLRMVLESASCAASLKRLDLSNNRFGDLGADVLAQWKAATKLEELTLQFSEVTHVGRNAILVSLRERGRAGVVIN